jgi:hypothetical protein
MPDVGNPMFPPIDLGPLPKVNIPPCLASVANNGKTGGRMTTGMVVGGVVVGGAVLVLNIVGAPEVPAGEAAVVTSAGGTTALTATWFSDFLGGLSEAADPGVQMLRGAMYGIPAGGALAVLATPATCVGQ